MPDKEKPKQTDKGVKVMSSGIDYVYVSGVQMFANNWDLRMFFADRQPDNSLLPKLGIVMSHQHAKAFSELLQKQIENLEELFGPIQLHGQPVVKDVDLEDGESSDGEG